MQDYRRHIEEHPLPTFEASVIGGMVSADVTAWEKGERAAGYAESSIKTWRSTLHLILADAEDEGLCDSDPAVRPGPNAPAGLSVVIRRRRSRRGCC